ncbi:hypothetical protein [Microbacterium tumbae]
MLRPLLILLGTVVGLVAVLVVVYFLLNGSGGAPGSSSDDDFSYPWDDDDPVVAVSTESGWTASGTGVIRLDGWERGSVIELSFADDDDPAAEPVIDSFALTLPGGEPVVGDYTTSQSAYQSPVYFVAPAAELEIWVETEHGGEWVVSVSRADLPRPDDVMSGTGDAAFIYTGGASTARVTGGGDGPLFIDAVTASGRESIPTIEEGEPRSIAWRDSPTVVFRVTAFGDAPWTIRFGEPVR